MDLNKKLEELKPYQLNCNVFDVYSYNGLTMQDLLCQFFTKINECITVSNETIDLAKWLVNEGLKIEVAEKLVKWLDDGTLENIINVNLFNSLNNKINNINNQIDYINNKEIVSIIDFGAVGDKLNDDTEAIKKALKKGRYVTAKGEKHYIISDLIEIPEHVTLDFNNAYVTFIGSNACFQLKRSSSIKNVRINIKSGLVLNKSVIYLDGNDVFNVGWSHTPYIDNISITQEGSSGDVSYRSNVGIWFDNRQKIANNRCCITGVLVKNVKAVLLKHIIYITVSDQINNTSNVFVTSNTFDSIMGYNCTCFIKDEIIIGSTSKASVGSNVYNNLHLQPADDIYTQYIDISGRGNSFTNALFWDNERPSNKTDQVVIRGDYNYISGSVIPPYKTGYVNIIGKYNYYQGFTYGIPTQYFGGKYISGRGYQKEWKEKLLPMEYTYDKSLKNVTSGLIENSSDTVAVEIPLTYGDIGYGTTKISIESIGTCEKTTEIRRFWCSYGDTKYYCGGSSASAYGDNYKCNVEYIIRKYNENYVDIIVQLVYTIGSTERVCKLKTDRKYNITDNTQINPKLLMGSTSNANMTQLYHDIKIDFHE